MDKFKEQMAVVQKHAFWVVCAIVLVMSVVSWYMATSRISQDYTRFKGEIETKYKTLSSIPEKHPNDSTLKGMDELNLKVAADVAEAWDLLEKKQVSLLLWPKRFDQEFHAAVQGLRPPELKVAGGLKEELSADNRTLYRDYIIEVLPGLATMIRSKWLASARGASAAGAGGMMPGMPGGFGDAGGAAFPGIGGAGFPGGAGGIGGAGQADAEDLKDVVVTWKDSNQRELQQIHFGFAASDANPTTLQVLYAQEDLWLLEAIMRIIAATNKEAIHRHEAAIRHIEYVRIGRSALGVAGKVSAVGSRGGVGGGIVDGGGMMPGGMMPGGMSDAGGVPSPGVATAGGETPGGADAGGGVPVPGDAGGAVPGGMVPGGVMPGGMMPGGANLGAAVARGDFASNRYVDRDYKPLARDRLVAAMKGSPTDPKDLLLAVAKRVPVRLNFRMDQRRLSNLLANCANSPIPIEVKQVRINRSGTGGIGGGGMDDGSGMMPGGMSPGGMMPGGIMPGDAGGDAGGVPLPGEESGGAALPGAFGGFGGAAPGGIQPGGFGGAAPGGMQPGGLAPGGKARSEIADSRIDPNEISVEIYGIIYLYNPVNRELLGLPAEVPSPPAVEPTTTPTSTTPPATPPANTGAASVPASAAPVTGLSKSN
jgi:hypothetical protein